MAWTFLRLKQEQKANVQAFGDENILDAEWIPVNRLPFERILSVDSQRFVRFLSGAGAKQVCTCCSDRLNIDPERNFFRFGRNFFLVVGNYSRKQFPAGSSA
jgi:hypothetical protein